MIGSSSHYIYDGQEYRSNQHLQPQQMNLHQQLQPPQQYEASGANIVSQHSDEDACCRSPGNSTGIDNLFQPHATSTANFHHTADLRTQIATVAQTTNQPPEPDSSYIWTESAPTTPIGYLPWSSVTSPDYSVGHTNPLSWHPNLSSETHTINTIHNVYMSPREGTIPAHHAALNECDTNLPQSPHSESAGQDFLSASVFQEQPQTSPLVPEFYPSSRLPTSQSPTITEAPQIQTIPLYNVATDYQTTPRGFRAIRGRENDARPHLSPPLVVPQASDQDNPNLSEMDASNESQMRYKENIMPSFKRRQKLSNTELENERLLSYLSIGSKDQRYFSPRNSKSRVTYHSISPPSGVHQASPPLRENNYLNNDFSPTKSRYPPRIKMIQRSERQNASTPCPWDQCRPTVTWHYPVESIDSDSEKMPQTHHINGRKTSPFFDIDKLKPLSPLYDSSNSETDSNLSTVPDFISTSSSLSSSSPSLSLPILDNPVISPNYGQQNAKEHLLLQKQECKQFYRKLFKIRKRFTSKWIDDNLPFLADPTTHPYTSPLLPTEDNNRREVAIPKISDDTAFTPFTSLPAVQQLMQASCETFHGPNSSSASMGTHPAVTQPLSNLTSHDPYPAIHQSNQCSPWSPDYFGHLQDGRNLVHNSNPRSQPSTFC